MDNYLEHLIKQVLDNDTGKLERYYKNEVNKEIIELGNNLLKFQQISIDKLKTYL